MRLCTKFQVSSSTHFGDKLGCTPKLMGSRDLSYAPVLDFFAVLDILPLCVCVPNFNFLDLLTLEISQGVRQKLWVSRDPGYDPFLDFSQRVFEILPLCIGVPNFKSLALLTLKISQGVRQNLWVSRDVGYAPFLDFSLPFWTHCYSASVHQISSLQLYSLWR